MEWIYLVMFIITWGVVGTLGDEGYISVMDWAPGMPAPYVTGFLYGIVWPITLLIFLIRLLTLYVLNEWESRNG